MISAIIYGTISFLTKGGGSLFTRLRSGVAALILFLVSGLSVAAASIPDSLQFRILFSVDSSTVQTELFDNAAVLSEFRRAYDKLDKDDSASISGLTICGSVSSEGDYEKNIRLARKRAWAVYRYLRREFSVPDSTIKDVYSLPVGASASSILSSFPESFPGIDLPSIRKIAGSATGLQVRQAFRKLDGDDGDVNWNWYEENILAPSRYAQINLYYCKIVRDAVPEQAAEDVTRQVEEPEPGPQPQPEPQPEQEPEQEQPERLKSEFRLGTNLLYDVATVANLFFEAGFARHMALNLSATFSPWDIRRPDIKLRTLLVQPELRWYFADNFKGHYLGVEGHYGWWNVAVGGKTRYQDRDGSTPLWGAGLSYGYSLAFNSHFGMDFGISAGYANLIYDCFYNIENGAKFTTKTRSWWGPTRVGISIYYQF